MSLIKTVTKKPENLDENERSKVRTSGKFKGCLVGRDKKGFYVMRADEWARSGSYAALDNIPESIIFSFQPPDVRAEAKEAKNE